MRLSETGCRRGLAAAALLLSALVALPAAAAELSLRKLRIETDPPGAEVLLIGGKAGYTPLTIDERALYPNDYPDDQAHLYGTVTLRRAGCETVVHRVTLDDLGRGLTVALDCGAPFAVRAAPAGKPATPGSAAPPAPAVPSAASGPAAAEAASQRRLRQLQVLQELLDEGLIDSAEEQRIRRRLLEAP
jgi:hypothetical protein